MRKRSSKTSGPSRRDMTASKQAGSGSFHIRCVVGYQQQRNLRLVRFKQASEGRDGGHRGTGIEHDHIHGAGTKEFQSTMQVGGLNYLIAAFGKDQLTALSAPVSILSTVGISTGIPPTLELVNAATMVHRPRAGVLGCGCGVVFLSKC